ncbi:30S ribosomal protein S8 [Alphaproteobacteria bacterium]|nr:30S ribosomal protein S8 [Alphaproteobacteria bacterium]GHS95640.1 30S ribosomal protein S8 [Alphaproteobacteria bacterium]
MLILDPIGDLLTRIRNGQKARKEFVDVPVSKEREAVLKVLVNEGYLSGYTKEKDKQEFDILRVQLKYSSGGGAIQMIKRVSKPGKRVYASVRTLRPVYNGLGISILSTSKGVLTDVQAREFSVGGEVLCSVF